ncbi:MAG: DNA-binding protein [Lachnospiraceae bacterium]|nr:DNA-binding protein [Lachnospiraceae bacterium]
MNERNLKQIDILERAQPYCEQYNIKLSKSDLSQYVSGKVEPGQHKLSILGLALNVSEAWLMGYDVPMERMEIEVNNSDTKSLRKRLLQYQNLFAEYVLNNDDTSFIQKYLNLNNIGKQKLNERADELINLGYTKEKDGSLKSG